jgi:peptidoglycan/xylan/chitin deacetylase (PgdA/CDA1 family)
LTATFYISTEAIDAQRPYWWKRLEYAVDHARVPRAQAALSNGSTFDIDATQGYYALGELKSALKRMPVPEVEVVIASVEAQLDVSLANDARPYTQVMTWDDVVKLQRLGMTIGSHSVSHPNLATLAVPELRDELERSRAIIENRTDRACRHFCYPYGGYSETACSAARAAGYRSAVTTVSPGWNQRGADLFRLRRFALPAAPHRSRFVLSGIQELAVRRRSNIPHEFAGHGPALSGEFSASGYFKPA